MYVAMEHDKVGKLKAVHDILLSETASFLISIIIYL